ncbi:MAG: sigma-70 family RNA polymerase sigma factor [Deltaproteobacteria bacterium]|nr:sigma-70 family RNA polymerase sigma factor [Deltaproteobacteria bacterium]
MRKADEKTDSGNESIEFHYQIKPDSDRPPHQVGSEEDQPQTSARPAETSEEIMAPYFREMRNIELLSPEEELELGRRIKEAQTALLDLFLKGRTSFLPLRSYKRKLKKWLNKKKTSREPIEYIFQEMERAVQAVEKVKRPESELRTFIKDYKRLCEELNTAMGEMVAANLRLAVNIAKRFSHRGMPLPDLIQEGNVGLMKAVARYDYSTGNRFSTFASWWIRQTISRALYDQGRTIRVPVHFMEARNIFYRSYFELVKRLGREPTLFETAECSGLSLERILTIIQMSREPVSLETPISEDGDLLGDLIENEEVTSPLDALQDNELYLLTEAALDTLTPREKQILCMRFGLGDEDTCTLEKVGQALNISRERVRQLEKRALKRLRHSPQRHKLKNYVSG